MRDNFTFEPMDFLVLGDHHGEGFSQKRWTNVVIPQARRFLRLANVRQVRVSYTPQAREYCFDMKLWLDRTLQVVLRGDEYCVRKGDTEAFHTPDPRAIAQQIQRLRLRGQYA
jgi:hypothetical protein